MNTNQELSTAFGIKESAMALLRARKKTGIGNRNSRKNANRTAVPPSVDSKIALTAPKTRPRMAAELLLRENGGCLLQPAELLPFVNGMRIMS